ncbi:hypothetical protein GC197_15195 [bacterium]|nr:hypothetical protein [bacterium]
MWISLSTILTVIALLIAFLYSAVTYAPGSGSERDKMVMIFLAIAVIFTLPRIASLFVVVGTPPTPKPLQHADDDPDNPYRSPENP